MLVRGQGGSSKGAWGGAGLAQRGQGGECTKGPGTPLHGSRGGSREGRRSRELLSWNSQSETHRCAPRAKI